jgi:hypothetical protein
LNRVLTHNDNASAKWQPSHWVRDTVTSLTANSRPHHAIGADGRAGTLHNVIIARQHNTFNR